MWWKSAERNIKENIFTKFIFYSSRTIASSKSGTENSSALYVNAVKALAFRLIEFNRHRAILIYEVGSSLSDGN